MRTSLVSWLCGAALLSGGVAQAQAPDQNTFALRSLTPETALAAAQATLQRCRAQGFQVAVAVVDRSGITQVLLRDRFAGPHTVNLAQDKAWTALSFRTPTQDLVHLTQPGQPMSGLRGNLLGAIGVSGAPGGEADEDCAKAGLKAIADRIDF